MQFTEHGAAIWSYTVDDGRLELGKQTLFVDSEVRTALMNGTEYRHLVDESLIMIVRSSRFIMFDFQRMVILYPTLLYKLLRYETRHDERE